MLGNNQYQITFTFYRGVFVVPALNPDLIFTNSCGYANPSVTMNQVGTPVQISPVFVHRQR
ncbi:MAG: hypothetical protein U0X76_04200 [Bacteroidia bacterium]